MHKNTFDTVVLRCPPLSTADSKAGFFLFPNRGLQNITKLKAVVTNYHRYIMS